MKDNIPILSQEKCSPAMSDWTTSSSHVHVFMFASAQSVFPGTDTLFFVCPPGCFNGQNRTGLAVDSQRSPSIATACCVNGRGLSVFDLRVPLPLDFIYDVSDLEINNHLVVNICCLFVDHL